MSNKEKYDRVFIESFSVDAEKLNEKLEYNSIETWDSIGHMQMIAELEDIFIYTNRSNIKFVEQITSTFDNMDVFINMLENVLENYEDDEKERNVVSDDLFFSEILKTDIISNESKIIDVRPYKEYINPKLKQIIIVHNDEKHNVQLVLDKLCKLYSNEKYEIEIILSYTENINVDKIKSELKIKKVSSKNNSYKELLIKAKEKISYNTDIILMQTSNIYQCSEIILYSLLNLTKNKYYSYPIYNLTSEKEKIGLQYMFNNDRCCRDTPGFCR